MLSLPKAEDIDVDMGVLRALSQEPGPLHRKCCTQPCKTDVLQSARSIVEKAKASRWVQEEGCVSTGT